MMKQRRSRYRKDLGHVGETLAARFLLVRGITLIERNVFVDGDELDLVVRDGDQCVAVEVKTTANGDDPMEAIDDLKTIRVRRAVSGYGQTVHRIDAIGVRITSGGVSIQWIKGAL